jgi:hypothetical protein
MGLHFSESGPPTIPLKKIQHGEPSKNLGNFWNSMIARSNSDRGQEQSRVEMSPPWQHLPCAAWAMKSPINWSLNANGVSEWEINNTYVRIYIYIYIHIINDDTLISEQSPPTWSISPFSSERIPKCVRTKLGHVHGPEDDLPSQHMRHPLRAKGECNNRLPLHRWIWWIWARGKIEDTATMVGCLFCVCFLGSFWTWWS